MLAWQTVSLIILTTNPLLGGTIPMSVHRGRPIVDQVYLDGHGPYRFLLDTGAEANQLDAKVAMRAHLEANLQVEIRTPAGVTKAPLAHGITVRLGPVEADAQVFVFTPLEAIHQWAADVQGALGQSFLSRFDYLLDFDARRIEFGKQEREGLRVPFERITGRPAVSTSLGRLVLDSGSARLILFQKKPASGSNMIVQTESGSVTMVTGSERLLVLEGWTIKHSGILIAPPQGQEEDGLLPVSLFHTVYVCNSERYLVLQVTSRAKP
jgi:hypothetical protein